VVARLLEFSLWRTLHPTWSARGAVFLCCLGLVLLIPAKPTLALVAMALYGAGNGLLTIVRGTLPLAQAPVKGECLLPLSRHTAEARGESWARNRESDLAL